MRLALALLLAVLLSVTAFAAAPPRAVNLDSDPELETVLEREIACFGDRDEHPAPCAQDEVVAEAQVTIADTCAGAERRFDLLSSTYNRVGATVLEADGERSRPELLAEGSSGAGGYLGEAAVVRLDGGGAECGRPRVLFRHPGPRARTPRPRGATHSVTGSVRLRDYRRDLPGRELKLAQSWYRGSDAGCCPTWISTRFFRYDKPSDRYVPYRSSIRRRR